MNKRQLKKARKKAGYWVLARDGATLWMMKGSCAKLTARERQILGSEIKEAEQHRDESFRQACIEVLGEDPVTDWQ